MNCKPGDLAVIVRAKYAKEHIGKIVRCTEFFHSDDGPSWFIGEILPNKRGGRDYFAVLDRNLRPIRDPGDDAVDETLLCLPAPKREEVTS